MSHSPSDEDVRKGRGMTIVPERLITARKKAGLTQQQLGELVGADKMTISRLENRRKRPSETMLEEIVAQLSKHGALVSAEHLRGMPEPVNPPNKCRVLSSTDFDSAPEPARALFLAMRRGDNEDMTEYQWARALELAVEFHKMGLLDATGRLHRSSSGTNGSAKSV